MQNSIAKDAMYILLIIITGKIQKAKKGLINVRS